MEEPSSGPAAAPSAQPEPGDPLASLGCRLVPAHDADAAELLRFETAEREHFRRWIPDRGDDYYDLASVDRSLADARRWWKADSDLLHVVEDGEGRIVARVNLTELGDGSAELGYRVAADATGRGLATAAVTAVLAVARERGLHQVRATTSADNAASGRVLVRCGFEEVGSRPGALTFEGGLLDAIDWRRDLL